MSEKLSALIISDGRAGHLNRSKGVVLALQLRKTVDVKTLNITHNKIFPRGFLPRLARLLPAKLFLKAAHGIDFDSLPKPDVIISAGGKTIGANAALAELWGVPNIYTGKLRGMPEGAIEISFPPYRFNGEPKPRRMLWAPVNLNPDDFAPPKKFVGKGNSVGFLIGGNTAPVAFNADAWDKIAVLAEELAKKVKRIIIATSPRTPNDAYAALLGLREIENIEIIDFRKAGIGSAKPVFECDAICATLDSTSMITEAIAARRPVIALRPRQIKPTPDIDDLDEQVEQKRMAGVDIESEDVDGLLAKLVKLKPITENHLEVLADAIFADLEV